MVTFRFRGSPSTTRTRMAGPLDKQRLVGSVAIGCERVAQHRGAEGLGRLRQHDGLAAKRAGNRACLLVHLLDRVVRLQRGDRRSALDRGRHRAPDQSIAHERTRGVVNHDHVGSGVGGGKRGRHRISTARAAGIRAAWASTRPAGTRAARPARLPATPPPDYPRCRRPTNASTLRWSIGMPPRVSSCFGRARPRRRPRPPAAMMAATCTVARFYPGQRTHAQPQLEITMIGRA